MSKWIVVNVGCIECGVSTNIVGVFTDEARAKRVAKACGEKYDWREGGQNAFEVFPMPADGVIHPEYDLTPMERTAKP